MTSQRQSSAKRSHILIIEDEEDIARLISYNLLKAGFHVTCTESGEEGLKALEAEHVDCLLLDLMLPGMSGMQVCGIVRTGRKTLSLPIIMLTARSEDADIIAGLEYGADDYIAKPFSPKVLVARINAVLRRKTDPAPDIEEIIRLGRLKINPGRHEVFLGDKPVSLTMTEFGILVLLAGRPGWVFSRQQIIDSIRGYDFLVTSRAVDVQIFGLRKKLGPDGSLIETVRGLGYRCKEE